MKISIVTSYFNRKELLISTLKSIKKTNHKNFEFIIVDDASNEENRIEDLVEEFPFVKVFRIEPENKWYVNPCVPFNFGFSKATGDIVIIQNPECFHTSDILTYVDQNLKEEDYYVFGCYSLSDETTKKLLIDPDHHKSINFQQRCATFNGDDAWYNHSFHRPVGYHFTSAIYKTKLTDLGGFDERFAYGHGFDDDELLHRIKKICNFKIVDNPLVLHQHHYNMNYTTNIDPKKLKDNRSLFSELTMKENKIKVNN
jgi:glycosyltransferase involved in cell wall biosynthesis